MKKMKNQIKVKNNNQMKAMMSHLKNLNRTQNKKVKEKENVVEVDGVRGLHRLAYKS